MLHARVAYYALMANKLFEQRPQNALEVAAQIPALRQRAQEAVPRLMERARHDDSLVVHGFAIGRVATHGGFVSLEEIAPRLEQREKGWSFIMRVPLGEESYMNVGGTTSMSLFSLSLLRPAGITESGFGFNDYGEVTVFTAEGNVRGSRQRQPDEEHTLYNPEEYTLRYPSGEEPDGEPVISGLTAREQQLMTTDGAYGVLYHRVATSVTLLAGAAGAP